MTRLRSRVGSLVYQKLVKKILFTQDPEKVHNCFTFIGNKLGKSRFAKNFTNVLFNYQNPVLSQTIKGIKFENPICLAAGFDYNANLTQILPSVGFGGMTIGSLTYGSYNGNNHPRLGRLPKSRSLLVNKGLKNKGVKSICKSLEKLNFKIPLGISVAKTNCPSSVSCEGGVKDYIESFRILNSYGIGDYYELNISCPNAFGGEPFTRTELLEPLLIEIDKLSLNKPLFVKMPIDLSLNETEKLCEVCADHNIDGLIFGNLTKDRCNPLLVKEEVEKWNKGAFSGKPTEEKSNERIAFVYRKYKKRFVIIGCGGVFSAEDAYKKIKLGASLVQLATGMIFQGPSLIGEINEGLTKLLRKDGYSRIQEAIGKGV
jgi:dihydroorotate dehydrogenase subfamily 2